MPQFDYTTFPTQLVWLAITFVTLYLVMSRIALPKVAAILEERRARIASDLAEAARLRDATAKAIADYEQALAEAKTQAQSVARQVSDETSATLKSQRAESDQSIAAKLGSAEKRIAEVRDTAVAHVGEIAADVAQAVVAHVTGQSTDSSELRTAINEALGK